MGTIEMPLGRGLGDGVAETMGGHWPDILLVDA